MALRSGNILTTRGSQGGATDSTLPLSIVESYYHRIEPLVLEDVQLEELHILDRGNDVFFLVLVQRVQVLPERAFKNERVLTDDRKLAPELLEVLDPGVDLVDYEIALVYVNDSCQGQCDRGLSGPRPSDYSNFLVSPDVQVYFL